MSKHLAIGGNKESRKQAWQTPWSFFNALEKRYGKFTIDVCASAENTKCERFYTEKDNSLTKSWKGERVFDNPPFELKEEFLEKHYKEWIDNRTRSVLVLPCDTSVGWFHSWIELVPFTLVKGRIPFISEDLKRPKSGNNKGTMIF